ncbi:MAG: nuclear transport factor 2 family protein [Pseudomonadota bacterium]
MNNIEDADVKISRAVYEQLVLTAAKQEIFELSATYMRALDRLDAELMKSVYHPDATFEIGIYSGDGDGFTAFAMEALGPHERNHHMLGQANIDVEGDVAFGEIYFQAFHRVHEEGGDQDFVVLGRYVDRYEKRGGAWKMTHRTELFDFSQELPASDHWLSSSPEVPRGFRGSNDLSSQRNQIPLN